MQPLNLMTKQMPDPHAIALEALTWILSEPSRADRFLNLTGLDPASLRHSAGLTSTHVAILDFLLAHEPDLIAAARDLQMEPRGFVEAREGLNR